MGVVALLLFISIANASWLTAASGVRAVKIAARIPADGPCPTREDVWRAAAKAEGPALVNAETGAGCPDLADILTDSGNTPMLVRMTSGPATLAAIDKSRQQLDGHLGFVGDTAAVRAILARQPSAWAWTWAESRQCQREYALRGWLTLIPESCKGKTMLVTLDDQWRMPGWPRAAMKRLKAEGTRIILASHLTAKGEPVGLSTIADMERVPVDYDGYLWIEDIETISRLRME